MTIDKNFIDKFVNITSKAALASSYLVGKKNKIAADKAAVDSMRSELNNLEMKGQIVIGEGELDEAPMLYIGEKVNVENIELKAIYTPGHTDCSYSYLMNDRVFTGDTLLINGTGRTDFQNGSSYDAYESLFGKLLKLPEKTLIYPAHDYNGKKNSTIENEKNNNPRLQIKFFCNMFLNTWIYICKSSNST